MADDGHPILAAVLDIAMWSLRPVRRRLLAQAKGRVLEIGVGTGANFRWYTQARELVGIEPDPYMLKRARRRAESTRFPVRVERGVAEALPFAEREFDTVVCTWTLCTVPEPERALAEVRRVLRDGGELLFAEHVRARGRAAAWVQTKLTPLWNRCSGGCHLDRDTGATIRRAGFSHVELEAIGRQTFNLVPHIVGSARR
jgi:ubiquinone/menaquinone biosynthesis C-methylase UbiE